MATARNVLENIAAVIEATTPATPGYGGSLKFRHADKAYEIEDVGDVNSPTRRFIVSLTGDRSLTGTMGACVSPTSVEQGFTVSVLYAQGADAWELSKVIAEDVDTLGWALMSYTNYDASTTSISKVAVSTYAIQIDGAENGLAILTIPVDVTYRPTVY